MVKQEGQARLERSALEAAAPFDAAMGTRLPRTGPSYKYTQISAITCQLELPLTCIAFRSQRTYLAGACPEGLPCSYASQRSHASTVLSLRVIHDQERLSTRNLVVAHANYASSLSIW